jgi:hypothetical protein
MEYESKLSFKCLTGKQIIDVSRKRNCWKDEELKDIEITYHNICEIHKQLEHKDK